MYSRESCVAKGSKELLESYHENLNEIETLKRVIGETVQSSNAFEGQASELEGKIRDHEMAIAERERAIRELVGVLGGQLDDDQ